MEVNYVKSKRRLLGRVDINHEKIVFWILHQATLFGSETLTNPKESPFWFIFTRVRFSVSRGYLQWVIRHSGLVGLVCGLVGDMHHCLLHFLNPTITPLLLTNRQGQGHWSNDPVNRQMFETQTRAPEPNSWLVANKDHRNQDILLHLIQGLFSDSNPGPFKWIQSSRQITATHKSLGATS